MIIRVVLLMILLALRFYNLELRPPHHDEAVNGWFVDGILNKGYYQYDPQNYHGPMFFYILTFFTKIFGRSLFVLRLPIVLFSWLVNLTPFLFRRWIGSTGAWIAAFFLAVSPAMVFYSRYTIHEMEFMLACILFFYFWLRTRVESFHPATIWGLGLTLGAMACLKENFVMYLACLFIAEGMTRAYEKFFPKYVDDKSPVLFTRPKELGMGLLSVVAIAFAMICLIFSALGHDQNGISNFFTAFAYWSDTGSSGHGHQKPYYYWINIFFRLEWAGLIGLILCGFALKKLPSALRMLSIMSVGVLMAYTIVAYKTPWCLLSFYWGMIFIAAYWLGRWIQKKYYPGAWYVLIAVILGYSAYQSYVCAYDQVDAEGHPYIYGQTYRDFMVPLNQILESGKADPKLHDTLKIAVVSTFTWPLPYILGEFHQVGYYGENNTPPVLDNDFIIIDSPLEKAMAPRIKGPYSRQVVRSRQWALPVVVFTRLPEKK